MKCAFFGAGKIGAKLYNLHKDKYDIVCFVDNDPKKQGGRFQGLDVISPQGLVGSGLDVFITSKSHFDICKQLWELGIKEFYALSARLSKEFTYIDVREYDDISENPNKICVMERHNSGQAGSSLVGCEIYDDIEVVSINESNWDGNYFYQYLTSKLIISLNAQKCFGKKSIEIWHGFPIKAMWYMDREVSVAYRETSRDSLIKKDAVCSLSEFCSVLLGNCIKISPDKFTITGYPRNDNLINTDGRETLKKVFHNIGFEKAVIYAPTYRNSLNDKDGRRDYSIFNMPDFDIAAFDNWLREKKVLFIVKAHPVQIDDLSHVQMSNLLFLTDADLHFHGIDLYDILNGFDCLISDYSSIIIDYLLVDNPIVLAPLDLEEYQKNRGILLQPYEVWMPGEIVLDFNQFYTALENALFGEDRYKEDRERLRKSTHKYTDGKSAHRVLALARQILGIG